MKPAPLALALLALVSTVRAQERKPIDWAAHYRKRVEAFREANRALDPARKNVVLVGDSLTEGWGKGERLAKAFPDLAGRVIERGISSDGIGISQRGVKNRLDESVFDCRPAQVVLLIGVNDIGRGGRGIPPLVERYREVVRAIRQKLPDVPLHVVTVAPARGQAYGWLNEHIPTLNRELAKLAAEEGARLVDLHAELKDARGELPAALTTDGLHWNDAGYERVGKVFAKAVAEATGAAGAVERR